MTDTAEKIECRSCGKTVLLTASGAVRKHRDDDGRPCSGAITIALPWAKPPLAQNDRQNWQVKARAFAHAKHEARWMIRAARVAPVDRAEVVLHYRVPDRRTRDADGPAPTLKAVLDALVDEGVLPADSWRNVPACGVRIHPPRRGLPACMWVELTPVAGD